MLLQNELVNYIVQNYNVAAPDAVTPVTAGFLSANYVLHAKGEKYFLKQYRFTQWQAVAAVHEAKLFFAQANVPVILPLTNRSGETFFALADKYYSLFPFVQGQHLSRGSFSPRALASCAKMLADIHWAGQQAKPLYVRKTNVTRSYTPFVDTAQAILQKIPKVGRTAFDDLAETCIQRKLHLAQRHIADFPTIALVSDHLIHGDYQDGNLFFDAQEQVSHVFDWEKAEIAPRALELVRALEFICLSNPDDYKAVFSEENYAKARHFLQSYHERYPMTQEAFFAAAQTRYLHKILSLWVEADHYLEDNQRVDVFLEAEYHAVNYYAQHLNEYVERISGGLLA